MMGEEREEMIVVSASFPTALERKRWVVQRLGPSCALVSRIPSPVAECPPTPNQWVAR